MSSLERAKSLDFAEFDPFRALDEIPKLCGTHYLSREGYDEESKLKCRNKMQPADGRIECRNVLVRYCAHIPRNYQYRDGVQQVRGGQISIPAKSYNSCV